MPTTTKATQPGVLIDTTTVAPTAELNFYYDNPRRGDIPAIARSLKRLKQYKPLIGNIGTLTGRPNEVLAGNHTLAAIRELADTDPGDQTWKRAKVHWVDVDNEEARLINLTDNRTAELGGYDNTSLLEALKGVDAVDLSNIGYSAEYLQMLVEVTAGPPNLDALADEAGDPLPDDGHARVRLILEPGVAEEWASHRAGFNNDTAAMQVLLNP